MNTKQLLASLKSYKTTALGLVIAAIALFDQVRELIQFVDVEKLTASLAALGLIFAKDGDKRSQDVGLDED